DGRGVHRMTDVRVRAGIDDFLLRFNSDIRGRPTIGFDDPQDGEKRSYDDRVADHGDPCRHPRKTAPVIEYGQNDERKERDEDQGANYPLRPFLLMPRPRLHASLEQWLVVDGEIDRKGPR